MSGGRAQDQKATVVVAEIEWLDRLRRELDPHVGPAVAELVRLMKDAKRENVKLKAASRLLSSYVDAAESSARLRELGRAAREDAESDDRVRVVVVDSAKVPQVAAMLAGKHQERRRLARESGGEDDE